jgi:hypothetical protein
VEELATQFLRGDLDVDCPTCGYSLWVRWSEVVAQTTVLCPCCRIRIRLLDDRGGMQTAGEVLERMLGKGMT